MGELCGFCGREATGHAWIDEVRYCHEGKSPTCYELAQHPTTDKRPARPPMGTWDPQIQSFVIKQTDQWIVSVTPMLFNDRVYLTHVREYPWTWSAGWCYDKGGAAYMAAHIYNPDTDPEPVGYKKVAADQRGHRG